MDATPLPIKKPMKKKRFRKTKFVLLGLLGLIILLSISGFLYQTIATNIDTRNHPPPGNLVDVGGYRLHLYCTGDARDDTPTIIMEAGLGGTVLDWSKIQSPLAASTRVCSYDRAGYGWSDSSPHARTGATIVKELHTLLTKADITGPYLLVGHSLGGLYVRLYALAYPNDIAGMVLVDSSHEKQHLQNQQVRDAIASVTQLMFLAKTVSPLGVTRLMGEFGQPLMDIPFYPAELQPAVKTLAARTELPATAYEEFSRFDESSAPLRAIAHPAADFPLLVLTPAAPSIPEQQQDMARFSSNSTILMGKQTEHYMQLAEPELLIEIIMETLTE